MSLSFNSTNIVFSSGLAKRLRITFWLFDPSVKVYFMLGLKKASNQARIPASAAINHENQSNGNATRGVSSSGTTMISSSETLIV